MAPEISVILPVYNAAEYLSQSIESILNQSYQNFELLITDDGSTDSSKSIIGSYSDSRIKFFENTQNKGLIYVLNKSIEASKGKYIARMDADDIALADRFKIQYEFMEQHPGIGACGAYALYIGDRNGTWQYPVSNDGIRCRLLWGSSIIHPSAIIRKNILTQNNIQYKEQYALAEDFKLWVDIGKFSQLYNIPEVLLKYRTHNQQETVTKKNLMDETKTKIIAEQIISAGVKIRENDFTILLKFIAYEYHFTLNELMRLLEIYKQFISLNNVSGIYNPQIINQQIKDRIFEACYFSTKECGMEAIKLFKQHFGFKDIGFQKKLKFYYKGIMR